MRRALRYNLVDVFTGTPLEGNPLAVFTQGAGLDDARMQAIAREMNLSETVFFLPPEQGGHARVRIFTPRVELPFAGHPVLGSAWILAGPMLVDELRLETGVGMVSVFLDRQGDRLHRATMVQPLPQLRPFKGEDALRTALGLDARDDDQLPACYANNGPEHVLVEAASAVKLHALDPDFREVARLTRTGTLVFAQEGGHCHARYFAPAAGIDEDPATGSAVGPLGAYLVLTGRMESGIEFEVSQGATLGRPSTLYVCASLSSKEIERVTVGGRAVVIARGEMLL